MGVMAYSLFWGLWEIPEYGNYGMFLIMGTITLRTLNYVGIMV